MKKEKEERRHTKEDIHKKKAETITQKARIKKKE